MMLTSWLHSGILQLSRQESFLLPRWLSCILNQKQLQPGSGAFTLSLLTCATHGRPQLESRSNATNRSLECASITPIPLCNQEEWRCRYVFGYSLDDSDKPVFLIWPERTFFFEQSCARRYNCGSHEAVLK